MNRLENTILSNLFFREEYARKALPFLKAEYFSKRIEQILFGEIVQFVEKYNNLPTKETILIEVFLNLVMKAHMSKMPLKLKSFMMMRYVMGIAL